MADEFRGARGNRFRPLNQLASRRPPAVFFAPPRGKGIKYTTCVTTNVAFGCTSPGTKGIYG